MSEDPLLAPDAPWLLLRHGPMMPALNMAIDEILLESCGTRGAPVLRLYSWSEPAATFGYFQKYADIARWTSLRPLIRRPTGGGLVPHDADWTYSLSFPPGHPWYGLPAATSYERVHAWIQFSFSFRGHEMVLADKSRPGSPGQCFAGAERSDVIWNDRKVAGAAQRRSRHGLLIQGSIQPPTGFVRAEWEADFCQAATERWAVQWQPWTLPTQMEKEAQSRARRKFSCSEYNERR